MKRLFVMAVALLFSLSINSSIVRAEEVTLTNLDHPPILINQDGIMVNKEEDHVFELWVIVFDSRYLNSGKCDRQTLINDYHDVEIKAKTKTSQNYYLDIANEQMHLAPYVSSATIGVCIFKKDGEKFKVSSFNELGIKSIGLQSVQKGDSVAGAAATKQFSDWISHEGPIYTITADALHERSDGSNWPLNAMARLVFKTEKTEWYAYFKMKRRGFLAYGLSPLTTYGFTIGNQGNAIILPLVAHFGYGLLVKNNSRFYIGLGAFVSPSIEVVDGQISKVVSMVLGPRVDFGGYAALGLGYKIDFTGATRGAGVVAFTIGPDLLQKLIGTKADPESGQSKNGNQ